MPGKLVHFELPSTHCQDRDGIAFSLFESDESVSG
jgi:hypothetical protein